MGQGITLLLVIDNSGNKIESDWIKSSIKGVEDKLDFSEVKVLSAGKNLGFSAGMNFGYSWADERYRFEHYLLINNDAIASKNMVSNLQSYLGETPGVAMVSPVIRTGEGLSGINWYHRWLGVNAIKGSLGCFPWLSGCCLLLSGKYFEKQVFSESFFMYGEDVELSWRLFQKGIGYEVVKDAFVTHEKAGSSSEGGFFYEYYMNKGHLILSKKLANTKLEMLFMFATKFSYLLVRSLVRSVRFRSLAPVFTLVMAFFPLKIRPFLDEG